ncbi:GxxExxY protein [Spirosoma rigui]|uniref:GxxExxY protein n=1 Tax=Spirosoma rigui TaxID=564064 RepID=UPI0009B00D42|nr:GxxExxY protein [Spirosoma rigui]
MRFSEGQLTSIVIGRAIEVHRALGPGLPESAYQECLLHELQEAPAGLTHQRSCKNAS